MKNKIILISTVIFFILINTSYYWESQLGIFAMLSSLLLFLSFVSLSIVLFIQLVFLIKEKFRNKSRIVTIGILIPVLALTVYKPFGLIDFDTLEGKDVLIAMREGAANCMTTFKLKENNKFRESSVCFGKNEINGTYQIKNDTIYFDKVNLGRHGSEYYECAIIRQSTYKWNKGGFELIRFKNKNDTVGHELTVTVNKLKE